MVYIVDKIDLATAKLCVASSVLTCSRGIGTHRLCRQDQLHAILSYGRAPDQLLLECVLNAHLEAAHSGGAADRTDTVPERFTYVYSTQGRSDKDVFRDVLVETKDRT